MREVRFRRIELRTTDVEGARAFYRVLFEHDEAPVIALPAESAARGARPHWLGHLGVEDLETSLAFFVERGATRLGPVRGENGESVAIVRDPGGAIVALTDAEGEPRVDVAWHSLSAIDVLRTQQSYAASFGWALGDEVDLGAHGRFRTFAWHAGGVEVGSMGDVTNRPGVHPHWLFHFRVRSLDRATEHVRASGGVVLAPFTLPSGDRIAVCDDPRGAAFALHEART